VGVGCISPFKIYMYMRADDDLGALKAKDDHLGALKAKDGKEGTLGRQEWIM
jgi:hypothetical protein